MFEVKFFEGSFLWRTTTCDIGDLLPTIATVLQEFEAYKNKYEYQRNYAIQWKRVKE